MIFTHKKGKKCKKSVQSVLIKQILNLLLIIQMLGTSFKEPFIRFSPLKLDGQRDRFALPSRVRILEMREGVREKGIPVECDRHPPLSASSVTFYQHFS